MAKVNKKYPAAQALIDKAMKVDPALAADIRAFARSREYGLVFEHNRPEAMRLYGKPIVVGDIVHVLPDRGLTESEASHEEWRVVGIDGDVAKLQQVDDGDVTCEAALDDIVAVAEYDQPIYAGLRETGRVERGGGTLGDPGDKPYHVVINGENYHALEALEFCYAGMVDCIYIDPPYNTGAKDWKYNNDYVDGNDAYRHSKWLAWMERRLKLAKTLLNPKESVLILTIDEKEYLRTGLLLEQTFPEAAVQMISSVTNPSGSSRNSRFARCVEYIYFVFFGDCPISRRKDDMLHPRQDGRNVRWDGFMRTGSDKLRSDRPNMFYPFIFSNTDGHLVTIGEPLAPDDAASDFVPPDGCFAVFPKVQDEERRWRMGVDSARDAWGKGYLSFGPWSTGDINRTVYYLPEGTRNMVENGELIPVGRGTDGELLFDGIEKDLIPFDVWNQPAHSATDFGSTLLGNLLGRDFPFPKSLYAVEDTLRFVVGEKPNALILDFFSGSGTTAHAVMRLNHQDDGLRRSISITNNEIGFESVKDFTEKGLRQGDAEWEQFGIANHITWPRISTVITGTKPNGEQLNGSYGVKTDMYQAVEGDILNPDTGNKMRGKFYKKVKVQSKAVPDPFPMADGFDENAVLFDLTYEDPEMVEYGMAFTEIAPLLWMRAGCVGRIIEREARDFAVADNYAVLFDYSRMKAFEEAIAGDEAIVTVFVVTDDDHRYANAKKTFPGRDVVRLYESYLHSFQIASEGALS